VKRVRIAIIAIVTGVALPAMSYAGEHGFLWLNQIGPLQELNHRLQPGEEAPMLDMGHMSVMHLAHSILAAIILVSLAWYGTRRIRNRSQGEGLVPDEKLTMKNVWELAVGALFNLVSDPLGEKDARKYLPFLGTLFLFILTCNIMGLVPGLLPPTSNVNINAGMAISVFVYYQYSGFKSHGMAYLKHFMGPILYLAPLMFVIEVLSHMVRMLSLSVRLFGNIFGDHTVTIIFTDLTKVGVPVIFLALGLFVSFIQALVFTLLSTIYFQLALVHDH
jgi:F-type H+-transporting ATPase subunit a